MARWRDVLSGTVVVCLLAGACGGARGNPSARRSEPRWSLKAGGFVELPVSPLREFGSVLPIEGGLFVVYGGGTSEPGKVPPLRAQLFDPASGTWIITTEEPFGPLLQPSLAAVPGGFIVVGVRCDRVEGDTESSCHPGHVAAGRYSTQDDAWTPLPVPSGVEVPVDASSAVGIVSDPDGSNLLVTIGSRSFRFRPNDNLFEEVE